MVTAALDKIKIQWTGIGTLDGAGAMPNLVFTYKGAKRMEDTDVAKIRTRLAEHRIGYTAVGDPEDLRHYQQPSRFRNSGKVVFYNVRSLGDSSTPAQIEADMQRVFKDMLLDAHVDVSLLTNDRTGTNTLRIEFNNKHLSQKMFPYEVTDRIRDALTENHITHSGDYEQRPLRFPNGNRSRLDFYEVRLIDGTQTSTEIQNIVRGIVTDIIEDWREGRLTAAVASPQPRAASVPAPTGRVEVSGVATGSAGSLVIQGEALSTEEIRGIGNMLRNVYGVRLIDGRTVDRVGGGSGRHRLGTTMSVYDIRFSGATLPTVEHVNEVVRAVRSDINTGRGHNGR